MASTGKSKDTIEVTCESCGEKLNVGRQFIGRHGRCPKCQTKFLIAAPQEGVTDASDFAPHAETDAAGHEAEEYEETPSFAIVLPWWQSWLEHLKTSGPCWIVSLAVHAALLVILAVITVAVPKSDKDTIAVGVQLKAEDEEKEVYLDKQDIRDRLNDTLPERPSMFADFAPQNVGIVTGPDTSGVVPVIGVTDGLARGQGNPFNVVAGPVDFFGSGGGKNVASVIYVVDRSASMEGDRLDTAKAELVRSIQRLTVGNMFNVIFFSDHDRQRACWPNMVLATTERKNEAYQFIEAVTAYGGTEPPSAMNQAIRARPDLIYLLTDGEFDKSAIRLIKDSMGAHAKGKKIRVNTIAFKDRSGERMLKQIASQNGGQYRFVR